MGQTVDQFGFDGIAETIGADRRNACRLCRQRRPVTGDDDGIDAA
jgi:hypothetical protein